MKYSGREQATRIRCRRCALRRQCAVWLSGVAARRQFESQAVESCALAGADPCLARRTQRCLRLAAEGQEFVAEVSLRATNGGAADARERIRRGTSCGTRRRSIPSMGCRWRRTCWTGTSRRRRRTSLGPLIMTYILRRRLAPMPLGRKCRFHHMAHCAAVQ